MSHKKHILKKTYHYTSTQHHTMTDTAKFVARSCPVGVAVWDDWLDDISNFTRFRSLCNHSPYIRIQGLIVLVTFDIQILIRRININ